MYVVYIMPNCIYIYICTIMTAASCISNIYMWSPNDSRSFCKQRLACISNTFGPRRFEWTEINRRLLLLYFPILYVWTSFTWKDMFVKNRITPHCITCTGIVQWLRRHNSPKGMMSNTEYSESVSVLTVTPTTNWTTLFCVFIKFSRWKL